MSADSISASVAMELAASANFQVPRSSMVLTLNLARSASECSAMPESADGGSARISLIVLPS